MSNAQSAERRLRWQNPEYRRRTLEAKRAAKAAGARPGGDTEKAQRARRRP